MFEKNVKKTRLKKKNSIDSYKIFVQTIFLIIFYRYEIQSNITQSIYIGVGYKYR